MARTEKFDPSAEYVALQPITVDGALAYNKGDAVPAANVKKGGYLDSAQVGKVGNKAAAAVLAEVAAVVTSTEE